MRINSWFGRAMRAKARNPSRGQRFHANKISAHPEISLDFDRAHDMVKRLHRASEAQRRELNHPTAALL